jgi:hypothetical protein
LLTQLASTQSELDGQLSELRRSGDTLALAIAANQSEGLARLQRRIATASPAHLPAIRAELAAITTAMAVLAGTHGLSPSAAQMPEDALERARAEARAQVAGFMADYYDRKIFEPYLRFASAEDEAAYREREERRRKEIEEARALGTPEGDLRALQLSKEQMRDAGAHGADKSPDFEARFAALSSSETQLTKASEARSPKAASNEADPPKDTAVADVALDPSLLALLKAKVAIADASKLDGHGLPRASEGETRGRA